MVKSAKPGTTRTPKTRLRVAKISVRELSARKTADVKGGMLEASRKACISK